MDVQSARAERSRFSTVLTGTALLAVPAGTAVSAASDDLAWG